MLLPMDQLKTIICNDPLKFIERNRSAALNSYFFVTLETSGEEFEDERRRRFKKYLVGYIQAAGGEIEGIAAAAGRFFILIGLEKSRDFEEFLYELKLVSKIYARRRLGLENFEWRKGEVSEVGFSQIESMKSQIWQRTRPEKKENYRALAAGKF